MLWIFLLCLEVFFSYCYINSCKMKPSVWLGTCWRPRTDKSKQTCGFWSWRSRRCRATLIARAVLTVKKKITKRQIWIKYSEEISSRNSRIKPKMPRLGSTGKLAEGTFSCRLVWTFYVTLQIEALSTWRLRTRVSLSRACVVTFG